jgi:WD40 repeat protein
MSIIPMQIIRDPLSSSPVHSLCSLPGNQLAVGTENKWFNVWTLHQKPSVLEMGPKTWGLFSSGTKSIISLADGCLAAAIDDCIVIVDTTGPSYSGIKAVLEGSGNYGPGHNGSAGCVTQSPDGRIISGGGDHDIIVWGLDRKKPEKYLRPPAFITHSICCTKDGLIVAGHDNGLLTIWDLSTSEQRAALKVSKKAVRTICLLPDGRIAAGSDDGLISIWAVPFASKVCQLSFKGFRGPIRAICLHPNGSLISGSEDGLVMSWNLATGLCTRVVEQGTPVTAVAIMEDGRIAAGLANGQVKIWAIEK